ncbi:hypothetical protein R6Q57_027024 [Mikania cordata]
MAFFYAQDHDQHNRDVCPNNIYRLSELRFSGLLDVNGDDAGSSIRSLDERCSICLAEFRDDDRVSQLSRCGHVFHACCIESWFSRDQLTCPLCRSNLLCTPAKRVRVGLNQNSDEHFSPYWQW